MKPIEPTYLPLAVDVRINHIPDPDGLPDPLELAIEFETQDGRLFRRHISRTVAARLSERLAVLLTSPSFHLPRRTRRAK